LFDLEHLDCISLLFEARSKNDPQEQDDEDHPEHHPLFSNACLNNDPEDQDDEHHPEHHRLNGSSDEDDEADDEFSDEENDEDDEEDDYSTVTTAEKDKEEPPPAKCGKCSALATFFGPAEHHCEHCGGPGDKGLWICVGMNCLTCSSCTFQPLI